MTLDGAPTPSRYGRTHRAHRAARAFSLVELFLVITIIFVIFTLFISGGSKGYQVRQMAHCGKNLQHLYSALNTYSLDHQGALPLLGRFPCQLIEPFLQLPG